MKIFQISTFDLRSKWAEAVDTNDKTDENLDFKDLANLLDTKICFEREECGELMNPSSASNTTSNLLLTTGMLCVISTA